jgi:hypothetical protein
MSGAVQNPGVCPPSEQHGSPGPPHGSQVDSLLHGKSPLHVPAQQFCPGPPHPPAVQVNSDPPQATPEAQFWLQQKPLVVLQNPLMQSLCSSHATPLATLAMQFPPSQCAPLTQKSLAQHSCPTAPQVALPQVNPAPLHATPSGQFWLQQKPLVVLQFPLWQSLGSSHSSPFARSPTHAPPSQWALPTQWLSSLQVVRQALTPQTYGEQFVSAPGTQVPMPLHVS